MLRMTSYSDSGVMRRHGRRVVEDESRRIVALPHKTGTTDNSEVATEGREWCQKLFTFISNVVIRVVWVVASRVIGVGSMKRVVGTARDEARDVRRVQLL
jgi:hypothetical protein